ncbi:hypothetical protein BJK33_26435 [Escherichia coli]|nr:hypothetical protein BJK33_26435 [Escherichia coli]
MLPSETMIWQPEFTDKTLSRKPGAVQYGIMRSDFAVLIANIVTLFLAAPVLVITLINRRKKHV